MVGWVFDKKKNNSNYNTTGTCIERVKNPCMTQEPHNYDTGQGSNRRNKCQLMAKSGTEPAVFFPEVAKQHDV